MLRGTLYYHNENIKYKTAVFTLYIFFKIKVPEKSINLFLHFTSVVAAPKIKPHYKALSSFNRVIRHSKIST